MSGSETRDAAAFHAQPRTRLSLSLVLFVSVLGLGGCHATGSSPATAAAPEPPPPAPAELAERRAELRQALAALTTRLGRPLPVPAEGDPVGIDRRTFEESEVEVSLPDMADRAVVGRARAWKGRVHTLELTLSPACDSVCAAWMEATLAEWLGPPHVLKEGRARIVTAAADTVRFVFEWYERRPELSRLVLVCTPLKARAAARPSVLPDVGGSRYLDPHPPCRALPASVLAVSPKADS